MYALIYINP